MTYANFMTNMVGVAALGLTTSLGMGEALAQNPSSLPPPPSRTDVYSPPPPTASVYRPAPIQPYVMSSSSKASPYEGPTISDSTPWWQLQEGRYAIFGGFTLFMLGLAGSIFWTIRNHYKNGGE